MGAEKSSQVRARLRARVAVLSLYIVMPATVLSQTVVCSDWHPVSPPEVRGCHWYDSSCKEDNTRNQQWYERELKRFNYAVAGTQNSDKPEASFVDSLVGCRGESVQMIIKTGNVERLAYKIVAPSGVTIASGMGTPANGPEIRRSMTLTESGIYRFALATFRRQPRVEQSSNNDPLSKAIVGRLLGSKAAAKQDSQPPQQTVIYDREIGISFVSDAGIEPCEPGDAIDGTAVDDAPFHRRFALKSGQSGVVELTSVNSDFIVTLADANGREVAHSPVARDWKSTRLEGHDGEPLVIDARPARRGESVGIHLTCGLYEKPKATSLALGQVMSSAFTLPPAFAGDPTHELTAHYTVHVAAAGKMRLVVNASELRGLSVQVLAFDIATERVYMDRAFGPGDQTATLTVPAAGDIAINVTPIAARNLAGGGEAKYELTVDSIASSGPGARARRKRAP